MLIELFHLIISHEASNLTSSTGNNTNDGAQRTAVDQRTYIRSHAFQHPPEHAFFGLYVQFDQFHMRITHEVNNLRYGKETDERRHQRDPAGQVIVKDETGFAADLAISYG